MLRIASKPGSLQEGFQSDRDTNEQGERNQKEKHLFQKYKYTSKTLCKIKLINLGMGIWHSN